MDINVNGGKFVLINETSGNVCCVNSYYGRYSASRSTCYKYKQEMSRKFPKCKYAVYVLVRLGK